MRDRLSVITVALALSFAFGSSQPVQSDAQGTGSVNITVSAAPDATPIAGARVFLIGWSAASSSALVTDADGRVEIDAIGAGDYRLLVQHPQFQDAHKDIWVATDAVTVVEVQLARLPKLLARVTAVSSTISSSVQRLNQKSAERKLSENLINAINMLAGANVALGSDGQATGISIRGHDLSATSYNIGGMHVGGSAAMQGFDPDLVASAEVDMTHEQVNLLLSGPTHDPTYTFDSLVGGFDSTRTKIMAQATAGSVGFVVSAVSRGAQSDLSGATYLDESGLTYQHTGTFHSDAALLKAVVPIGTSWNASMDYLARTVNEQPLSDIFAGPVPEGIGPNNFSTQRGATVQLALNGTAGDWLVGANVGRISWYDVQDDLNRIVAETPFPNYGTTQGYALSMSLEGSRMFSLDHGLTMELEQSSNVWNNNTFDPSFGNLPSLATADNTLDTLEVQDMRLGHTSGLSLRSTLDLINVQNSGWRPSLEETLGLGRGGNSWKLDAAVGATPTYGLSAQSVQDPALATYDCADQKIFASLPGDTNAHETSAGASLEYSRALKHVSMSATVYGEVDNGVLLSDAMVAAPYEPLTLASPSYLQSLVAGYATYGNCGGAAPTFDSIYFQQSVGGLKIAYSGLNLTSRVNVTTAFEVTASYAFTRAVLLTRDFRLESPNSPFIFGQQLPNVPLQKLSLTEDWAWHDGRTELLSNQILMSANNAQNLTPYSLVTIGMERHLSSVSMLTLVASNATHEDVGLFVSPRLAIPLSTVSGVPFSTLATPLTQPRLTADFSVEVGN